MYWKILIILSMLPFFFSCSLSGDKKPIPLNILLITIDTIRSDHLGCYGYKKIKTPNIDQLAGEGALFENAFSPVPLTLPSHASILTGTYPASHGIRNNGTYALPESNITLPELLKKEGYITAAFVSSYVLDKRFGLDQGFDVYNDDLSHGNDRTLFHSERQAEIVTRATIKWLKELTRDKFFLWVHYFDPHKHYYPPPPFADEYADNLYDGEIAYTDHWLGIFIETLHQLKLSENTLILLTGDHGEGLGEHQEETHGIFIYDSTLRVPLICKYPKVLAESQRIKSLVRLIDIAPTILDIAGCKPYKGMQGISLLPLMKGKEKDLGLILYGESFYPQFSHNWSPLKAVRTEKWKYIEAPIKELYRIDEDPHEKINIFRQELGTAKILGLRLSQLEDTITSRSTNQDTLRIPLDKETKEKMYSLGYISSSSNKHTIGNYPDPKEMIGILTHFDRGMEYFGEGLYEQAKEQFQKVLEKHSQDVEAHTVLGHTYTAMGEYEKSIVHFKKALELGCKDLRIYIKLGDMYIKCKRHQAAIAVLKEALQVNPRCKDVCITLSVCYLHQGKTDQALFQLQELLKVDPHDKKALNHLAIIYQRQKKYNQAILSAKAVLKNDPDNISALLIHGSTLLYMQRYQEALEILLKTLQLKPDSEKAHYYLGLVFFRLKRMNKAVVHFKRAIQLNPNSAELHFNLGFIYHQQKNFTQARKEYQTALRLKPDFANAGKMLEQIKHPLNKE